jgi:hypothetical protein
MSYDGWIVSGGVELLHAGHKTSLMCTTVYLWCHNHLFCIRPRFMAETFFCVACFLVEKVWSYRHQFTAVFEYQLIVGLINPNYNSNSRLVFFESVFPSNAAINKSCLICLFCLFSKKACLFIQVGLWCFQNKNIQKYKYWTSDFDSLIQQFPI